MPCHTDEDWHRWTIKSLAKRFAAKHGLADYKGIKATVAQAVDNAELKRAAAEDETAGNAATASWQLTSSMMKLQMLVTWLTNMPACTAFERKGCNALQPCSRLQPVTALQRSLSADSASCCHQGAVRGQHWSIWMSLMHPLPLAADDGVPLDGPTDASDAASKSPAVQQQPAVQPSARPRRAAAAGAFAAVLQYRLAGTDASPGTAPRSAAVAGLKPQGRVQTDLTNATTVRMHSTDRTACLNAWRVDTEAHVSA